MKNNQCFSAEQPRRDSERITSSDMPPGAQSEHICHCQTLLPFGSHPPTSCCTLVYVHHVCFRLSGSYKLQTDSACNLRYGYDCRRPLYLSSVL